MADKPPALITPLAELRLKALVLVQKAMEGLAEVDQKLIALGAGRYSDASGEIVFNVIGATEEKTGAVSYAMPRDGEEAARNFSGEQFNKLFVRTTTYAPCEGFELIAPKLLTPAAAKKLVAHCAVPGKVTPAKSAYVKKG